MTNETVEVPIKWLEGLIGHSENTRVEIHGDRLDDTKLVYLKGYINSAKALIIKDKETN